MNDKLSKLAERRAALSARSALQRTEVAQAMEPWRRPLELADKGLGVVRFVRQRRPVFLVAVMLATAIWRPRNMLGWLKRGWGMWRMAQTARRRLSG